MTLAVFLSLSLSESSSGELPVKHQTPFMSDRQPDATWMQSLFFIKTNCLLYIDVCFMYIISPAHLVPRGHGRLMFHLSHYVQTVRDVPIVYSLFKLKHHP